MTDTIVDGLMNAAPGHLFVRYAAEESLAERKRRKWNEMKEAVLRYKCRRCGEVVDGAITGEKNVVPFLIEIECGHMPPGIPQAMTDIHHCPDGGIGVSDLIGADIRGEP